MLKWNLMNPDVIYVGIAVAIAILIRSYPGNWRVHRVRAALDSCDWTRLGPYHTGKRGRGYFLKSAGDILIAQQICPFLSSSITVSDMMDVLHVVTSVSRTS